MVDILAGIQEYQLEKYFFYFLRFFMPSFRISCIEFHRNEITPMLSYLPFRIYMQKLISAKFKRRRINITWKTKGITYLLPWTVPNCGAQYVGQTGRELFKRSSEHLYRFRKHKKFKCLLYQHLAKHKHNLKFV